MIRGSCAEGASGSLFHRLSEWCSRYVRAAELDEKYRPMALVNRAMANIELERYDEAAGILDQVVKANPTNARALFQQARIFMKRGQLDQAEHNIRQVLTLFPRDRLSLQQPHRTFPRSTAHRQRRPG